jgi:hypothetical protein
VSTPEQKYINRPEQKCISLGWFKFRQEEREGISPSPVRGTAGVSSDYLGGALSGFGRLRIVSDLTLAVFDLKLSPLSQLF